MSNTQRNNPNSRRTGLKNSQGHYQLITHRIEKSLHAGVVVDAMVYDASKLLGNPQLNSVMAIMDTWTSSNKVLTQKAKAIRAKEIRPKGIELKKCKLSAPLMYPGDIYCAGANYWEKCPGTSLNPLAPPSLGQTQRSRSRTTPRCWIGRSNWLL